MGSGCTTVMYGGPRRAKSEVALVKSGPGTTVIGLDRRRVDGGASANYEILPGDHLVAVVGQQVENKVFYNVVHRSAPNSLCFKARPGRKYVIERHRSGDDLWETFLTDEDSGVAPQGCTPRPRVSPNQAPGGDANLASSKSTSTAPPATAESAPGGEPATAPDPSNGATADASATALSPPPRVPAAAGRELATTQAWSDEPQPPAAPHPGSGFLLTLGGAFGGDELAKATYTNGDTATLSAGGGLVLAAGGMLTPLWIRNKVGLGLGAEIGWKYQTIGDSSRSISMSRFPMVLQLHSFLPLSQTWFLRPAFGIHKELAPTISDDSYGTIDLESPVGWMAELGVYSMSTWHLGWSVAVRFTSVHYTFRADRLDGNNVGVNLTMHINP